MKRSVFAQLSRWQAQPDRKPLIVKGARQVGKTYLLEQFGQQAFPNYYYLNFEKQPELAEYFTKDLDPKRIINELNFVLGQSIDIERDLLIFDEVQACPQALTSLKYFCEDMPELALCAAGSLLGIHLNDGSFPVGKVNWLNMYPMSFEEFLWGTGEEQLANFLETTDLEQAIPQAAHKRLWEQLKLYFIVGGLPEVVSVFAERKADLFTALQSVREAQQSLLKDYYADFAKHSGKVNAMHIDRLWQAVTQQLALSQDTSAKRFRFKGVVPNVDRYSRLANVVDWLSQAGLILKVAMVNTSQQPLKAYSKEGVFKLFMFDVGLLGAMSDLPVESILRYDCGSYKGYFAENFVCQELVYADSKPLYSWQENTAEVEFLKEFAGELYPIEVKSGSVTHAKSLSVYSKKYQPKRKIILSAKEKYCDRAKQTYHLPLYLAAKLSSYQL